MTENDLTPNLKALLLFIERHAAAETVARGTFDPYGIVLQRIAGEVNMIFLEVTDDSADMLKGRPAQQMLRKVEDMIRQYKTDRTAESVAVVSDAYMKPQEGGPEQSAVRTWLDDRGKQAVLVTIPYEIKNGTFIAEPKWFTPKSSLFLDPL